MNYTKAVIEKGKSDADFVAIASTAAEDRHGEVVSVEGWDLKNFKKNPVLLWSHDHTEMTVGKATKIWVEGSGKRAKLMIEGVIHEATEKARALKYLVKEGYIKTMSVGFMPQEMEDNTFTKQELLEVSFVNVPANQQSMITAYKSLTDAGFEQKTISELGIPTELIDKVNLLEKEVQKIKETRAKEEKSSASSGRLPSVRLSQRQLHQKAIERAAQKLAIGEKAPLPQESRRKNIVIIKRAIDTLNKMNKEEINGTH